MRTHCPLFAAVFTVLPAFLAGRTLVVTDGNYSVGPDGYGEYWLNSGPFILRHNGHTLDTDSGGLHLRNYTTASSGIDKLGRWQDTVFRMETQGVLMEARMITYPLDNPDIVVFQQRFPQGLKGCKAASVNMTISGFPTFRMEQIPVNSSLGYLMFNGYMMGDRSKTFGRWVSGPPDVAGGLDGSGPLVLYDTQGGVILISPMDQLMAASVWLDGDVLAWGIMGGVDNLPPGFQFQTLLYTGTSGVGQAFKEWGRVLRQWYGKTSDVVKYHQEQDITLTHLGYWTDNGAYYYYHTETDKDYAATLNDVRQDAKTRSLPYRYMQIDSWWYPKDSLGAVTTWDAMDDIFPHGLKALHSDLQLPIAAHNRYWSKNTTYAKQNGGQFDFFIGQNLSLPTSQAFWDWLLKTSSEWGLVLYEQDWLNKQLLETELLWTSLTAGSDWLDSMARAARDNNMKIQYCMSQSRHALYSLNWPEVTQARVTDDYHLYRENWKIGVTSHFAAALGLAPSKDTFWTSMVEPGNRYNLTEPMPELQSAVATLSTGPVGPGDAINFTSRETIMRCCADDGLILKPSRPATAIDAMFHEMSFGEGSGTSGEVWSTYTDFGDFMRFGIIFTANVTRPFNVTPTNVGFSPMIPQFPDSVLFARDTPDLLRTFTDRAPFDITNSTCSSSRAPDFCLFYTAPVLTVSGVKLVVQGELAKWVPMSTQRVLRLTVTSSSVSLTLRGQPGETITFFYTLDGELTNTTVTVDPNSCAVITITPTSHLSSSISPSGATSTAVTSSASSSPDVSTEQPGSTTHVQPTTAGSSSAHPVSAESTRTSNTVHEGDTLVLGLAPPASCSFSPPPFTPPPPPPAPTTSPETSSVEVSSQGHDSSTSEVSTNTTPAGGATTVQTSVLMMLLVLLTARLV